MDDRVLFWPDVRRPDKIKVIWSLMWRLFVIALASSLAYMIVGALTGIVAIETGTDAAELTPFLQFLLFCAAFVMLIGFGIVYVYWSFSTRLGAFHLVFVTGPSSSEAKAGNRSAEARVVAAEAGPVRHVVKQGRFIYGLALFSLVFFFASWLFLALLLAQYVPIQAAWAANAGAPLPLVTRVMVATSNWSVRFLFPIWPVVISVGAVLLAYLIAKRKAHPPPVAVASICAVVLGALALVAVVASGVVVVCMHLPWAELSVAQYR